MSFLVSDTSVIIDLDRGDLLELAFGLDKDLVVPDLLFARELDREFGDRLRGLGIVVEPLDSAEVTTAMNQRRSNPRLSIADAFAFALAHSRRWTLLTGDGVLRAVAQSEGVEVYGVLWLIDLIEEGQLCDPSVLHDRLSNLASHPRCHLPRNEVNFRLQRYKSG
jgi:predicted nucleic acid-binding protein